MKTIHQLPPSIIAKIAAGEVIEKPAFAVKELIENSIDANATHIQIHLEESGLKKILVIDDGVGMDEEDLKECFKLHTTSKINPNPEADLVAIDSMGFRGEALASIASISQISIQSRTSDNHSGTKIVVEDGKVRSITPIGMPEGTQIEVLDLFGKVPGRKKFIENSQKEYLLVLNWLIKIALGNPKIRFTFTHNKKTIFDVPSQNLFERLQFFLKPHHELLKVSFEDSYIKITGFISKAENPTSSTSKQFLFVNQRPIDDKLVTTAIRESYGNTIESQKYPIYILNLEIPFELVDVNIHPRKEQIGIYNKQLIFDQVQKAILASLQEANPLLQTSKFPSITKSFAGQSMRQNEELFLIDTKNLGLNKIIQLHQLYLVFESKEGIIVVDQHAAHERVLYEQIKVDFLSKKDSKKKLKQPLQLNLSLSDQQLISANLKVIAQFGFDFNRKGELIEIPNLLIDRNIQAVLDEIIEQLSHNQKLSIDSKSEEMIKYIACRSAIKKGDQLTEKSAKDLIRKLLATKNNQFCPHGRPTFISWDLKKLNTQFKRN